MPSQTLADLLVSLQLDSASYTQGLKGASDETERFSSRAKKSHEAHANALNGLKREIVGTQRTVNFFARSLNDVIPASSGAGEALRLLGAGLTSGFGLGLGIEVVLASVKLVGEGFKEWKEHTEALHTALREFTQVSAAELAAYEVVAEQVAEQQNKKFGEVYLAMGKEAQDAYAKMDKALKDHQASLLKLTPAQKLVVGIETTGSELLQKRYRELAEMEARLAAVTSKAAIPGSVGVSSFGVNMEATLGVSKATEDVEKLKAAIQAVKAEIAKKEGPAFEELDREAAIRRYEFASESNRQLRTLETATALATASDKARIEINFQNELRTIRAEWIPKNVDYEKMLEDAARRKKAVEMLNLDRNLAREHAAAMRALQLELTIAQAPTTVDKVQAENANKLAAIDGKITQAREKNDLDAVRRLGEERTKQEEINGQRLLEAELAELAAQGKAIHAFNEAQARDKLQVDEAMRRRGEQFEKGSDSLLRSPTFAGTSAQAALQTEEMKSTYALIDEMRQKDIISEASAQRAKLNLALEHDTKRLSGAEGFFSTMAQLQNSSSRELAAIGKAAAIAQATIDGILAVQKALASEPPPWNFAIATAVGAVTAANVAQIAATGFMRGGFTGYGPTDETAGLVHRREFVVNAAATSRYRPMLEAINKGQSLPVGEESLSPVGFFSLSIENRGTAQNYEAAPTLTPNEIRLIAKDEASKAIRADAPHVIAAQFNAPNSRVSESVARSLLVARRR